MSRRFVPVPVSAIGNKYLKYQEMSFFLELDTLASPATAFCSRVVFVRNCFGVWKKINHVLEHEVEPRGSVSQLKP